MPTLTGKKSKKLAERVKLGDSLAWRAYMAKAAKSEEEKLKRDCVISVILTIICTIAAAALIIYIGKSMEEAIWLAKQVL